MVSQIGSILRGFHVSLNIVDFVSFVMTKIGSFHQWGIPKNAWFTENPIKIDDLGVPPFKETSISAMVHKQNLETAVGF